MIIEVLTVGPIMANCFIVACNETLEAFVIDPGDEAERILSRIRELNLSLKYIVNTHGHFDHVGANKQILNETNAELLIHALDAPMLDQLSTSAATWGLSAEDSPSPDRLISDGDSLSVGTITAKVLFTPGHTPGGISLLFNDTVFVGDTLFAGSIGRTDFPGGNFETLIHSIHTQLFPLADQTRVYPGHGPDTTIVREKQKRYNPFAGIE